MGTNNRIAASLLGFILLTFCAVAGFYDLFANFRSYDDEGVLMMSNQLFLAGQVPYRDIQWLYGPVQIATVQLLHDALRLPISHTTVRFITLALWLLLAVAAGLVTGRLTRSVIWSLTAAVLVFLFTGSIVNEPGHPQSLIALVSLSIPMLAGLRGEQRPRLAWFLVGTAAGVVFHIKLNAGVFLVAGISLLLASQYRPARHGNLLRRALIVTSLLLPFALMYPLLSIPGCLGFAALAALSAAGIAVTAPKVTVHALRVGRAAVCCGAGFIAVSVAALLYAGALGISPLNIAGNLLSYAGKQADFYHFFLRYSPLQIGLAAASLALAVALSRSEDLRVVSRITTAAKILFVVAAGYALFIDSAANAHAMAGYAWPWCWLVLLGTPYRSTTTGRLLLAAITAWAPLLAYPIPGSQIYFGSLAVLLAAIVCASDVVTAFQPGPVAGAPALKSRTGTVVAALVLSLAVIALLKQTVDVRERYLSHQPLELWGTRFMRLEPNRATHYRQLVRAVSGTDMAITTFRFYSLYLWSGGAIPTPQTVSHWRLELESPTEQYRVKEDLLEADRPIVISRKSEEKQASQSDIRRWIDRHFENYRSIGPYRLKRRRTPPPPSGRARSDSAPAAVPGLS